MGRPDHSTHHVADFIPQSVLRARHYDLRIATYPNQRFIEPAGLEKRALVLAPKHPAATFCDRELRLACIVAAVGFAVILYFLVPLLIGS